MLIETIDFGSQIESSDMSILEESQNSLNLTEIDIEL